MLGTHLRAWTLVVLTYLSLCLFPAQSVQAQSLQAQDAFPIVIAVSTFDVDAEGWTVTGDAQRGTGIPSFVASGGNPGGFLSATDDETGGVWYWQAPAKFLGNISEAYGQTLRFELRQSAITQQRDDYDVVLKGPGGTFYFDTPYNPGKTWTAYTAVLSETGGWTKSDGSIPTQAEMRALLSDVNTLQIRGEYRSAADTGDIDNVVLEGLHIPIVPLLYLPFTEK